MNKPLRVLIIEDSEDDAMLLVRELRSGGYEPSFERVDTADALSSALDRREWDIVLADYAMPSYDGVAALKLVRGRALDMPFIFVSGKIGEEMAVEAMRNGANDYIMKGNLKRLKPAIDRELAEAENRKLRRSAEAKIYHMAYYDDLTGLPNRNLLLERVQKSMRTDIGDTRPFALLLVDLDNFKDVNDTLGHLHGDALLKKVGERIGAALRPTDVIARLGGDEFAILMSLAALSHAVLVAQKIQKSLEEPFVVDGVHILVEASVGIALYPDHCDSTEVLMRRADVAMYSAKKAGSGHCIYDAKRDKHSPRSLMLMGELRQAIERNELNLHYQPKIDIRKNRVIGVEALIRWKHKVYGYIPPDEFIMSAERTGLIKPLSLWVLNVAHRQAVAWHKEGRRLSIAFNLSARNLVDSCLLDAISKAISASGLPPGRLEVEVTESVFMEDFQTVFDAFSRLRAIGIRVSIDDFGTGYSSLAYLKRLPVDTIKVDKTFVMNMCGNQNDSVIVRSTIDLAHNLGLNVVAEGVETAEILDNLSALDCDEVQGYHMCRPVPIDELTRWFGESPWGKMESAVNPLNKGGGA